MQTMVPGFWSSWLYNNGCQNEAIADQETLKDHMWGSGLGFFGNTKKDIQYYV